MIETMAEQYLKKQGNHEKKGGASKTQEHFRKRSVRTKSEKTNKITEREESIKYWLKRIWPRTLERK